MKAHLSFFHGGTFQLRDEAMRLGPLAGELTVLEGRVWLTRDADLGDHVVSSGARLRLQAHSGTVIEPLRGGERATVQWRPREPQPVRALAARALGGVAQGAARLAETSAAWAQKIAAGTQPGGDALPCVGGSR